MSSTQDTAEAGQELLGLLSDDELARYGEIAADQVTQELERRWLQGALGIAALGSGLWGAWGFIAAGLGRTGVLAMGVAAALGYWPYRKARTRALWKRHCEAVSAEQERRRNGTGAGQGTD